jgi:cytochrome c1
VTDPSVDGDPPVILTEQDQADIIAFLKLLK